LISLNGIYYTELTNMNKASNSAGQNPVPLKSNMGEDKITASETRDGRKTSKIIVVPSSQVEA
jgi:hypothetical protein